MNETKQTKENKMRKQKNIISLRITTANNIFHVVKILKGINFEILASGKITGNYNNPGKYILNGKSYSHLELVKIYQS